MSSRRFHVNARDISLIPVNLTPEGKRRNRKVFGSSYLSWCRKKIKNKNKREKQKYLKDNAFP